MSEANFTELAVWKQTAEKANQEREKAEAKLRIAASALNAIATTPRNKGAKKVARIALKEIEAAK